MRVRPGALLLAALCAGPSVLLAGVNAWTPAGPELVSVRAFAHDAARLYAATEAGVFRYDGGSLFYQVFGANDPVYSLAAVPAPGDSDGYATRLYAATDRGVLLSEGRGPFHPTSLTDPVTAVCATPERSTVFAAGARAWKSTDDGRTWRQVLELSDGATASDVAVDPFASVNVFLAVPGSGLLRSTDGGSTWAALSSAPRQPMRLAFDPRRAGYLYAAAHDRLSRSTDGGLSWTDLPIGPADRIAAVALDPERPGRIYAGGFKGPGQPFGVWLSTDDGASFRLIANNVSAPVQALAVGQFPEAIAGTEGGAFSLLSSYSSATWQRLTFQERRFDATGVAVSATGAVAVGTRFGVFVAPDGRTWREPPFGIAAVPVGPVAFDVADPRRILAGLTTDSATGGLALSTSAGESWEIVGEGIEEHAPVIAIAFHPRDGSRVWVAAAGSQRTGVAGGVFRSSDGGRTFAEASAGIANRFLSALAAAPSDPDVAYVAAARSLTHPGSLYRTTDGGESWHLVNAGPDAQGILALAVDPRDPDIVYSAAGPGVLRSADGGASFGTYGEIPSGATALLIDRDDPSAIYAGSSGAVHRFTEGGAKDLAFALPPGRVQTLTAGPANPRRIHAGLTTFGLQELDYEPFAVSGMTPDAAPTGGADVAIQGTGFAGRMTVRFGDATASASPSGDGRTLHVRAPAHAPGHLEVEVVSEAGERLTVPGGFTYVCHPPFARVSGGAAACPGQPVALRVDLEGDPPFTLTWADGLQQTAFGTTLTRTVKPAANTAYSLTEVSSAFCPGTVSGSAIVPVPFAETETPALEVAASLRPGEEAVATATGSSSSFRWSLTNGTLVSGQGTATLRFRAGTAGTLVVRVEEERSGCVSPAATALLTVRDEQAPTVVVERLIPVVLDAYGYQRSHYKTELVLANPNPEEAQVQLIYTASYALLASGSGVVETRLPAGHQLRIPDVLAYLRAGGLSIPQAFPGSQGGTLRVVLSTPSSRTLHASARITSPVPGGFAGVTLPAAPPPIYGSYYVFGLNGLYPGGLDRTNLALVDAGSQGSNTLRVTLHEGSPGGRRLELPAVRLAAGQWLQLGSLAAIAGFRPSYALVERTEGRNPFWTYGVVNQLSSNDGILLPGVPHRDPLDQTLPVAVESRDYTTRLLLGNHGVEPARCTLTFAGRHTASVTVEPEDVLSLDVFAALRVAGADLGPESELKAGPVASSCQGAAGSLAPLVGAGVFTTSGGFATEVPALDTAGLESREAYVFGLVENASSRSNLAVGNPGGEPVELEIQLYDGDTGARAAALPPITLPPGGWKQWNEVLADAALANGYARIVRLSGGPRFYAYGVVNDGAAPGLGTGDGSFLPMTAPTGR